MTATSRPGRIRRALTLIEAAMVLGILAIVTGGIVYGVDRLYTSNKLATTIEDVNAITLAMRDLHTGAADYAGAGQHNMLQALPNRWKSPGSGNFKAPVGEGLLLQGAFPMYRLTLYQVTDDDCVALAKGQYSRRVIAIEFGNIDHNLHQGPPLDRATIERDCRRRPKTDFTYTAR
jgi:hypothetical protein